MTHPYTNADRMSEMPIVRQDTSLWEWAAREAQAARALTAQIEAAREALARATTVLHASLEWKELDAAKERVKEARKAAVDGDDTVKAEREAVAKARAELKRTARDVVRAEKAAKANVKALVSAQADTRARVVEAIECGKVPGLEERTVRDAGGGA